MGPPSRVPVRIRKGSTGRGELEAGGLLHALHCVGAVPGRRRETVLSRPGAPVAFRVHPKFGSAARCLHVALVGGW